MEEERDLQRYGKRIKLDLSASEDLHTAENQVETIPHEGVSGSDLHSFFSDDKRHSHKAAVVFDDGKGTQQDMSYSSLNSSANFIKDVLMESLPPQTIFVGVHCKLGIMYPSLLLGILRSGKAFYNIDGRDWETAIDDGVRFLDLRYILSENISSLKGPIKGIAIQRLLKIFIPCVKLTFSLYELFPTPNVKSLSTDTFTGQIPPLRYAFAIQTSGTTGKKKTVLVPHTCISPNVVDFIRRWNVTSTDVVLGSAPPTFDPHIVELFVSLGTGATILYTTPDVKLNGPLLSSLLVHHNVSILQITPSLFRTVCSHLAGDSSLRLVALGGEKCPSVSELCALTSHFHNSKISFQNVYGVTEVSCWASVGNIDFSSANSISIGEGILQTQVALEVDASSEEGEIVIRSNTRFCVIIGENGSIESSGPVYRTGDIGRLTESGIVFLGRKDRVVKRNGMKVALHDIEMMALSSGLFLYAECKMHRGKLYLVVQLKSQCESLMENEENDESKGSGFNYCSLLTHALTSKLDLPLFMYPDSIIALRGIPVNSNGKIDFDPVIESLESEPTLNSYYISKEQILKTLEPVWRSCTWPGIRPVGELLLENFIHSGGDSVSSARFVEFAFTSLKLFGSELHQQYEGQVLRTLFDHSFGAVVDLFHEIMRSGMPLSAQMARVTQELLQTPQDRLSYPLSVSVSSAFELNMLQNDLDTENVFQEEGEDCAEESCYDALPSFPLEILTMYDFCLGLCVDSSPVIVPKKGSVQGERVVIGCHGGWLLCVDLEILRWAPRSPLAAIAWKMKLPNRLESTVTIDDQGLYGFVGCHDGSFYKFCVANGAVHSYTSSLSQDAIRSQGSVSKEHGSVIFVDSANNVYSVDMFNLNIKWVQSSFKVLATALPVISKRYCCISSVNKGLIVLDVISGRERWSCGSDHVKYSSPIIIKNSKGNTVVFSETENRDISKGLEMRNLKNGDILWQYSFSPTVTKGQSLFQPIIRHDCCNRISWMCPPSQIKMFKVLGEIIKNAQNIDTSFEINATANALLVKSVEGDCALLFVISKLRKLSVIYLHLNETSEIKPWFMVKEFESFSRPVTSKEFILFGGRDNKLHVIRCKLSKL